MIEQKKKFFELGMQIFTDQVCGRNQLHYTKAMVHMDGYRKAAEKFYEASGYLTTEERTELYDNGIVPSWMTEIFMQVEQRNFNITLWDKQ